MGKIDDRIKARQKELVMVGAGTPTRSFNKTMLQASNQVTLRDTPQVSQGSSISAYPDHIRRHYRLEDYERDDAFKKFKYIVIDHPELGEVALTFPSFLVHADMAAQNFRGLRIVSAGFYHVDYSEAKVWVHGRSDSIGIGSRVGKDEFLVARSLGFEV